MIAVFEILFWFSLFVVLYSYTIYPFLLFLFARRCNKPVRRDENFFPEIGVLVPVYNEERVIRKKIENLLSLDYPESKLSVWIGSDCSTDGTEKEVRSFNDPRIHFWVASERGGKTGVLNKLAPQIDADIILFTDANTMHNSNCLRMIARNFADETIGGVAGHIEHVQTGEEEFGEKLYRRFESRQKILEGMLHSTISAFGGFYAIRKKLFHPIPPNSYSNDDVLIPMNVVRQGYRVIYDPEALSEEDTTGNVAKEFTRRVRIGAGDFQAFFWLVHFLNPRYGWPWFCFVSHKVTRWFSPLFIMTLMLSCGFLFWQGEKVIYKMIFTTGSIFISAGLLYKLLPLRITRHVYYFMTMNLALLMGLFQYLRGIKSAAWSSTERQG